MCFFAKKMVLFAIKNHKIALFGISNIIFAVVNTFSAEAFQEFLQNLLMSTLFLNVDISVNFDF